MALNMTVIMAVLAVSAGVASGADVRLVKAIEFKGLKLLSKYEVVRGARIKAVAGGIAIDVDSLEEALEKNAFLSSHSIDESGHRLVVTVEEKKPALVLAMVKGGRTHLYELDGGHAVIARDEAHTGRVPFIYAAADDAGNGPVPARVRRLLAVLGRVREQNAVIYRELSEIYCNDNSIRVVLRGRKTGFILRPDAADFMKLKYVAGYCDRAERYPEEIDMTGSAVVVR
ncbi:MAG TPA: hypothetical protein PLM53_16185 [Spirochaetota bacterium]|nr:hypothetical protein [Spirochaetota bacterium]HQF10041.1 hypothetical protein [Spirochaetota bacterium]HQH98636.1 hypothetical protein [Spirochaetota bacterium]HRS77694.1 hypothetical protein [Spirochaetota bacterium]